MTCRSLPRQLPPKYRLATKGRTTQRTSNSGVPILLCGRMGAGKSTRSRRIAQSMNAILLSENGRLSAQIRRFVRGHRPATGLASGDGIGGQAVSIKVRMLFQLSASPAVRSERTRSSGR